MVPTVRLVTRAMLLGGLALFGAAVVLGHMLPTPVRIVTPERHQPVTISPQVFRSNDLDARFLLDPDSGAIAPLAHSGREVVELASFSPWQDEAGKRELVGRWFERSGTDQALIVAGPGIIRLKYPGGEVLDRVELSVCPMRPPCWYPGTADRILYVGQDQQLYSYTFEDEAESSGRPGRDQPYRLRWGPDLRTDTRILTTDPFWPSDSRFRGKLIAGVCRPDRTQDPSTFRYRLWWLELDPEGTEVVTGDRLLTPEGDDPDFEEIAPFVRCTPQGCLIAYLRFRHQDRAWTLHLNQIVFDGPNGAPRVDHTAGKLISMGRRPDRPVISTDGQWVWITLPTQGTFPETQRIPVAELLPGAASPPDHTAAAHPATLRAGRPARL